MTKIQPRASQTATKALAEGSLLKNRKAVKCEMKELIIKVDEEKMDIEGNAPLVEKPRELVRCKNCKKHYNELRCRCGGYTPDDWFCAGGVLKEGVTDVRS